MGNEISGLGVLEILMSKDVMNQQEELTNIKQDISILFNKNNIGQYLAALSVFSIFIMKC